MSWILSRNLSLTKGYTKNNTMPFVPHTDHDEQLMLATIGADSIESLFDEIPAALRTGVLNQIPEAISEMELLRLMNTRARQDQVPLSFLGAGAYEHHIPAAVWDLVSRGEFMTAYTPFQAEASQGTLQLVYEFQTMMTRLTGMDVANASVYDGASALAEAMLMAVRANRRSKSRRVLTLGSLNPRYLSACRHIVNHQHIVIKTLPWHETTGAFDSSQLDGLTGEDYAALVIPYPNFFGGLEDATQLTRWAHNQGQLVIAVVNPTALGILHSPGTWGDSGADIVVGEGQPLGVPLASGGPYLGFMCCQQAIVRQMPGRIIGRTVDLEGQPGFTLTLQAREQHIRRGKATSNICTNQGLLVTAAAIYLSLLGDVGLQAVARQCHQGLLNLVDQVSQIPGVNRKFSMPVFHEVVLQLPEVTNQTVPKVLTAMLRQGVVGGLDLGAMDASLANCLLVNVTETKSIEDLTLYCTNLERALTEVSQC